MDDVGSRAVGLLKSLAVSADPDEQLLARFVASADEEAFAEIVRRHGPMVLGACRRVLGNGPNVDDAFQAAFLVLARKAAKLCDRRAVGNWLFGVARNTALRLRDQERRRQRYESRVAARVTAEVINQVEIDAVDEELQLLPEQFRSPLVACVLEGRTQEEAAREVGCSLSTLRRNLDKGRELLKNRLIRRGIVPAVVTSGLGSSSIPPTVACETARLAVEFASGVSTAQAAAIAQGVLGTMTRVKLKAVLTAVVMIVGVAGGGLALQLASAKQSQQPTDAKAGPAQSGGSQAKTPQPEDNKSVPQSIPKDDKIRPGDILDLVADAVFEVAPLDGPYTVNKAGKIDIDARYGEPVKVEGLTIEEARAKLETQLRLYARKAKVSLKRHVPSTDIGVLEMRLEKVEQEVKELREAIQNLRKK
jgi:RNA polymerase sigma factor (sigma-70 family)